jgi:hypothetical protein
MPFQVVGQILDDESKVDFKIKPFLSKIFYTDETARRYAYSLVYKKDGNNKRTKNVLINWYIRTIPFGKL